MRQPDASFTIPTRDVSDCRFPLVPNSTVTRHFAGVALDGELLGVEIEGTGGPEDPENSAEVQGSSRRCFSLYPVSQVLEDVFSVGVDACDEEIAQGLFSSYRFFIFTVLDHHRFAGPVNGRKGVHLPRAVLEDQHEGLLKLAFLC